MTIENYLTQLESKTLEFKENFSSRDKILHTCIAFANTAGGEIIIGLSDKDKKPRGINNPHEAGEDIASYLHDCITPRILPDIEVLEWKGLYFIRIEIYPGSQKPYYEKKKGRKSGTYVRIGSTTRLADAGLIKSIERTLSLKSFDEELYPEISYEDLDFRAASEYFSNKKTLTENDFVTLNLVEKEQNKLCPTVGGVILFGKERLKHFSEAYIQAGYFGGEDKAKILRTKNITSYFPSALEEGLEFIKNSLGVGVEVAGLLNQQIWKIPRNALREALVNAVVHNDYSLRGAPIQISVFSNRVEIENNGGLLGLTIEEMQQGVSKLKNHVIGRTFFELGLIERWGSGIRRMIKECKDAGLSPPVFEEIGQRIRVTFFVEKKEDIIRLDKTDAKIIKAILEEEINTTHLISKKINLSKRATRSRLLRLINLGFILEIAKSSSDPTKTYKFVSDKNRSYTIES